MPWYTARLPDQLPSAHPQLRRRRAVPGPPLADVPATWRTGRGGGGGGEGPYPSCARGGLLSGRRVLQPPVDSHADAVAAGGAAAHAAEQPRAPGPPSAGAQVGGKAARGVGLAQVDWRPDAACLWLRFLIPGTIL